MPIFLPLCLSLLPLCVTTGANASEPLVLPINYHLDEQGRAVLWVEWKEPQWDMVNLARELVEIDRELTPRCRQRRLKEGRALAADINDLPPPNDLLNKLGKIPGLKIRTASKSIKAVSIAIPPTEMKKLLSLSGIKSITAVATKTPEEFIVQDNGLLPNLPDQWGYSRAQLSQINLIALQQEGYHGEGMIIGVMDSGFRTTHRCFSSLSIIASHDFTSDGDILQGANHGTAILSEIGGYDPGYYIGGAYRASFILAKTEEISFEQPIEEDWYVAGLEWCESLGADVVTTSLGYLDWYVYGELDGLHSPCSRAANVAFGRGLVLTTAAGNEAQYRIPFIIAPADSFGAIAIGAVDYNGTVAGFSSRGPLVDGRRKPDVCARGVDTWHAHPYIDDQYGNSDGTSLSTPLAGATAVLLRQAHPDWSAANVADSMRLTASMADNPDNTYGWGIINALDASSFVPLNPDPQGPQISASAQPNSFSPNNDGQQDTTTFLLSADDPDGVERWELALDNFQKPPQNLAMIFEGAGPPPPELVWDGRGLANRIVDPGDYIFHFSAWDRMGHRNTTANYTIHINSQADKLGRIIAYPNPVHPTRGERAVYFSYLPQNSHLFIYDLAGSKVAELVAGSNGEAIWEVAGTKSSSGIFLWMVECPWGTRQGKIAVLR